MGLAWGHTRYYTNRLLVGGDDVFHDYGQGYNWLVEEWPFVTRNPDNDDYIVVFGTRLVLVFASDFTPQHGSHYKLFLDTSPHRYVLQDDAGMRWEFNAPGAFAPRGKLKRVVAPSGQQINVTAYSSGRIGTAERSWNDGTHTYTEQFQYDYDADRRLESVVLRRKVDAGSWANVSKETYAYHDGADAFGLEGDLKVATSWRADGGSWIEDRNYYYRYHQDSDPGLGVKHCLKYVVDPAAYARMEAAHLDPLTVDDTTIAEYADYYFEYNSARRVSSEAVAGGDRTYTFGYDVYTGSNPPGYNQWSRKTVETRPDGSTNTVFTNFAGQVILLELAAAGGAKKWSNYYEYNDDGQETLHANPSAVSGWSLANSASNLSVTLRSADGLIELTTYGTSTTAWTSNTGGHSGDVIGYEKAKKIKRGTSGTEIKISDKKYWQTPPSVSPRFYYLGIETVYSKENGSGLANTYWTFSYQWYSGTRQFIWRSYRDAAGGLRTEWFNERGQLIWTLDERGTITGYVRDPLSGAVIQKIDDPDGTQPDFPPAWDANLDAWNLVTDYTVDHLGRVTMEKGPVHTIDIDGTATAVRSITTTLYLDDAHEVRTAQGYATGVGFNTYTLYNPISITKLDEEGRVIHQIQAKRGSDPTTSGDLSDSDTFAQSSYVRWTKNNYNAKGQLEASLVVFDISLVGTGAGYSQTLYVYDSLGRQSEVISPNGTRTITTYDTRNLPLTMNVGVKGTPDSPIISVKSFEYDNNAGGGDGNLTKETAYVDSTTSRVTSYLYDWRNRRVATDGELDFYEEYFYDNRSQLTVTQRRDTTSSGVRLSKEETAYDLAGRVQQRYIYEINPSNGASLSYVWDFTWYDEKGAVVKTQSHGSQLFTKTRYDRLGRPVKVYSAVDRSETGIFPTSSSYSPDVSNNTIFEQTETTYDEAGNAIQVTTRRRFHNATGTGELTEPGGSDPQGRISYMALWPDGMGRTIAMANYGSNGGTALARPDEVPDSDDGTLVTRTYYNERGEAYRTVDPTGREDRVVFDDAGRRLKTIQNYVDGNQTNGNLDEDIIVLYAYEFGGQVKKITARQRTTVADQPTQYVHAVAPSTGSDLYSNELLQLVSYPDSVGPDDRINYSYNRQGQVTKTTDQMGTVHRYDYDKLGRLIHDRVTSIASGIDGAVKRISTVYDNRGLVKKITSYDNATVGLGSAVNEIQNGYNNFRQLVTQYQSKTGSVNVSSTPRVSYTYQDGGIRRESILYPNGRTLYYYYNDGADNDLSRVSYLAEGDPGIQIHLADYSYLGLNSIVQVDYAQPSIRLDLAFGSGDDPYDGLDRFDRVHDQLWYDYGHSTDVARIRHGYDRTGNRLWREDLVATANSQHFDELYAYDDVQRLSDFKRGDLTSTDDGIESGTLNFRQDWVLDPLGNWTTFHEDSDGNGTNDLSQTRAFNKANEIINLSGGSWSAAAYDRNGNMTTMPQPQAPTSSYTAVYDAWNRLVKLKAGANTVADYAYDGLNHRIVTKSYTSGTLTATRHHYYSDQWQCLEERVVGSPTRTDRQFVWGMRYIDDLVLRDRDTNANGTVDERLYALQDPNWNVIALSDTSGTIEERYLYSAYGQARILTGSFGSRSSSSYDWETRYAGYRWDKASGLLHVRNRELNSAIGVWITRDRIAANNLYLYCNDNPARYQDPYGDICPPCVLFLAVGIAAIVFSGCGKPKAKGALTCGSFTLSMTTATPSTPQGQLAIGQTAPGYKVVFNPKGCTCPTTGGIKLVQAIQSPGFSADYDIGPQKKQPGTIYPGYVETGFTGGALYIVDSPVAYSITSGVHNITVCAVCHVGTNNETILGCVNFKWHDQNHATSPHTIGGGTGGGPYTAKQPEYPWPS